ncbi:MAG: hypothetical protein AB7O24_03590 [Kofleriaceae bacterium]
MAERTINARRKIVFTTCLDAVANAWSKLGTIANRRIDRFSLHPDETTEVLFDLCSVKRGLAKSEFGIYFSMIYRGGSIYDVLDRAGLASTDRSDRRLLSENSYSLRRCGSGGVYYAYLRNDLEKLGQRIANDVVRTLSPLLAALTKAGPSAVRLLQADPTLAEVPFTTVAAALALNGRLSGLDAFWRRTEAKEAWFDRPASPSDLARLRRKIEAAVVASRSIAKPSHRNR